MDLRRVRQARGTDLAAAVAHLARRLSLPACLAMQTTLIVEPLCVVGSLPLRDLDEALERAVSVVVPRRGAGHAREPANDAHLIAD